MFGIVGALIAPSLSLPNVPWSEGGGKSYTPKASTASHGKQSDSGPRMPAADSDSDSDGSDAPVIYEQQDDGEVPEEVKQTRQRKDWRPKATLHLKNPREMTFHERIVYRGLMSDSYHEMKPLDMDRGPIPSYSTLDTHAWILIRATAPILLQQASYTLFPNWKWHGAFAYFVYLSCFTEYLQAVIRHIDRLGKVYGTLNEKNIGRDRTPDYAIKKLARAFLAFLVLRTAGEFWLKWDRTEMPFDNFGWSTPVRMFAWLLTLDYFFYCYHRSCHEFDFLWFIHSHHHITRQPSPELAIIADGYQEVLEIALIPLTASLLVHLPFHALYLMICYCSFVEMLGHSGLRLEWDLPITGPLLKLVGAELLIEDHDLHHRYGRSGRNYGKQSRFWDRLFNTCTPREEMANLPGHRAY